MNPKECALLFRGALGFPLLWAPPSFAATSNLTANYFISTSPNARSILCACLTQIEFAAYLLSPRFRMVLNLFPQIRRHRLELRSSTTHQPRVLPFFELNEPNIRMQMQHTMYHMPTKCLGQEVYARVVLHDGTFWVSISPMGT